MINSQWWPKHEALETQLNTCPHPASKVWCPDCSRNVLWISETWCSRISESDILATEAAVTSKKPREAKSSMEKRNFFELHSTFSKGLVSGEGGQRCPIRGSWDSLNDGSPRLCVGRACSSAHRLRHRSPPPFRSGGNSWSESCNTDKSQRSFIFWVEDGVRHRGHLLNRNFPYLC